MNWFATLLASVIILIAGSPCWVSLELAQGRNNAAIKSSRLSSLTINQLEKRKAIITEEMGRLSKLSLRSGLGAIGYRSRAHFSGDQREWIRIDFDGEYEIEQVFLVPNLLRAIDANFRAEGFPLKFSVWLGTDDDQGTLIRSFDARDRLLPRIAPVSISINSIKASWIRIEADQLTARQYDGKYLLQFSEVMVFSGQRNVALHQTVSASTNEPTGSDAWDARYAVDGHTPYLMNAGKGAGSRAYFRGLPADSHPFITIDLEDKFLIHQLNLHLVDQSDTIPQEFGGDFGVPRELIIESATLEDFSDAKEIYRYHRRSMFDTGPILIFQFPETNCRFIRIHFKEPYLLTSNNSNQSASARIGFSEVVAFAKDRNVAKSKPVSASFGHRNSRLHALNDGNNFFGEVLTIRQWLDQLANHHDEG